MILKLEVDIGTKHIRASTDFKRQINDTFIVNIYSILLCFSVFIFVQNGLRRPFNEYFCDIYSESFVTTTFEWNLNIDCNKFIRDY